MNIKYLFRRSSFCLLLLFFFPVSCFAWEPTRADLEEAFLLWASPQAEYSGRPLDEAYAILTADSAATAQILPKFLATPSGSIRDKILTMCENLGGGFVGPAFRPHADPDSPNLPLVMYCLSRAHDTESLSIIISHLKHPRPAIRSTAAMSLGYLGQAAAVGDLIQTLRADTFAAVRKSAVFAIGQCLDTSTVTDSALDAVIAALGDDFFSVRFNAVRALARWDDPAVRRLMARFDMMDDTGRFGALQAMGKARTELGRPFLEKISADTTSPLTVRGSALKAMLERKWTPTDTDLADLRETPIGRGLFGLIR